MIRRTLKSGLLATVAVLAFLPTAAGVSTASAATPRPVPSATAQHHAHRAQHRTGRRVHHRRYVTTHRHHRAHLRTHHSRRVHRIHRLTARRAAHRFLPQTAAYRLVVQAAPYRLAAHRMQYRLAGRWMTYRHIQRLTGRVTTRHAPLNVRSGPGTGYRVIGHRQTGRVLALTCKTHGSSVHGNRTWYRLSHHAGYVSAHYVRPAHALPWC
ncbi:SH3 domain-containing protein [Streptomyces sp. NPDC059680]|uniref:SH3 domain-containing protein n=1 Tax=Streptomyces sp. NPDC059680 TaxID=3346904 RepID=UPI0036C68574